MVEKMQGASDKIKGRKMRKRVEQVAHTHWWVIPEGPGTRYVATCKLCGAKTTFPEMPVKKGKRPNALSIKFQDKEGGC